MWLFDPSENTIRPLVGNGSEALEDGPLSEAALAQPCGITSDHNTLFFADSESQAIRRATLDAAGTVTTIIGTGLFDYADKDGVGDGVLLQHPQAIVVHNGLLYVADSYNHKIKIVDPRSRECRSWLGGRRIAGFVNGPAAEAAFNEPGGLSTDGKQLFIADTNNHAIRVASFATGIVRTLELVGLET